MSKFVFDLIHARVQHNAITRETMEAQSTCYGGGDIAGAIFGTLICSVLLVGLAWWLYQKYWKGRKGLLYIFSKKYLYVDAQKFLFFIIISIHNFDRYVFI